MTLLGNKTLASRLRLQLFKSLLLSVFIPLPALAAPTPTVTVTELQNGLDHPGHWPFCRMTGAF